MRILTVVGARPQFIKASVISRALKAYIPNASEILVHTGQHYDFNMSDIFFDELKIAKPKYNLGVGGGTHAQNTGRMLEKLEQIMLIEDLDWVLVYGDTDSTLAGALAAAKLHIPVAHIESGLRSFNRRMPEEINRILVDHISSVLFSPTDLGKINLIEEGVKKEMIHVVGDVMYDAALFYNTFAKEPKWFNELGIKANEYILCTIHRAENTENLDYMRNIIIGLAESRLPIILPLHPRTKKILLETGLKFEKNIIMVDPVGYLEMVWLEKNSEKIVTDSGGVQKEAYFHNKFCITLRNETEWMELVDAGCNVIVGSNPLKIIKYINQDHTYKLKNDNLYGNGNAGKKIAEYFKNT